MKKIIRKKNYFFFNFFFLPFPFFISVVIIIIIIFSSLFPGFFLFPLPPLLYYFHWHLLLLYWIGVGDVLMFDRYKGYVSQKLRKTKIIVCLHNRTNPEIQAKLMFFFLDFDPPKIVYLETCLTKTFCPTLKSLNRNFGTYSDYSFAKNG